MLAAVINPAMRFLSANTWAMIPEVFADVVAIIERHSAGERLSEQELRAAVGDKPAGRESAMYRVGDTAVIPIRGVIARYADQVSGICQDAGRSAESVQADIKTAMADLMVRRIALRIDSPGGTVAGTAETAAAIRAASEGGKPVHAFVDGLAASAAYWLASAADSITVSASTAQVGSIGVITAHLDETARNEKQGMRVHVIRSVALKAPGTAGESLSPEQIDSIQRRIGQIHAAFADAVAAGRRLDAAQIAQVSTGEVWAAQQAKALGLIDGVQSFDAWMSSLSSTSGGRRIATPNKVSAMDIEQLSALTAKHPAKAADIVGMAKDGKTPEQIEAHLAEAARSEELGALKAAVDGHAADLKAEREAHVKTKADLKAAEDKLAALKANAATHDDPGHGKDQYHRGQMDLAAKAKFIREHGREAYESLPE